MSENELNHDQNSSYRGPNQDEIRHLARKLSRSSLSSTSFYSNAERNGQLPNPFVDQIKDTKLDPNGPNFSSEAWLKNMYRLYQTDPDRYPIKRLGVSFKNLAANGTNAGAEFQTTVDNVIYQLMKRFIDKIRSKHSGMNHVDILYPMDGVVQPGELVAVLGRPGAGCTTFLKTLSAETYGFSVGEKTEINYSSLSVHDIQHHFRGDVIYSAETEVHFPHLTVGQTLGFAALMRTPDNRLLGVSREQHAQHMRDVVMATFGISHTVDTKVGDDLVRGVSGGERKRVSIAEVVLCNAPLQIWDNTTRGLDSATAMEFIRSLKVAGNIYNATSLISMYQGSDEMYNLCDKLILLYGGRQIYCGKTSAAKQYFIDMGFEPHNRQNTPDFLTSLTSPKERHARAGWEDKVPRTAAEFEERWHQSSLYQDMQKELHEFNSTYVLHSENYESFKDAHNKRQSKAAPHNKPFTLSPALQVKYLTMRGFERIRGDFSMTFTTLFSHTVMALIIGSVFYNLKPDTESFYSRSAMIFFAILFNAFASMLEIFSLYEARPVVEKHRKYALYHPSCDAMGSIFTEFPTKVAVSLIMNVTLYFMCNLRREPGNFFIFLLFVFFTMVTMSHLFRTIGAVTKTIAEAMVPAVVLLLAMVAYTGFVIPVDYMRGWARWISYINPVGYAFETLMANEFHSREFPCAQFIPSGPAYSHVHEKNKVCSVTGSKAGDKSVQGTTYIQLAYKYKEDHVWRNFGIIVGYLFFLLGTYLFCTWANPGTRSKGEILVFPQRTLRKLNKEHKKAENDEESSIAQKESYRRYEPSSSGSTATATEQDIIESSNDIFYWTDVCYDIKIKGKTRRILDNIDGWVKPGTLTALMGATGAGKTTLLDTLANRVTTGIVTGHMYVNKYPRNDSFQRSTGYAQQQDLHLGTSTVREALIFSALLRQSWKTPRSEKIKYVENVLKILEMEDYADAVVGVPGQGLNVEQRKRLTIGVELAAKPKLLLFLDEPTSGLDSQTAWSICQLLNKLSRAGQAILCTIHQPSALLIQQFDRLLFLEQGGRTVYFGDIGPNCKTLTGYFEKHDADPCPPDANPAEWMLHVIGAAPGSTAKHDYGDVWQNSQERKAVREEIEQMMKNMGASDDNKSTEKITEFATPLWYQYLIVTKRVLQQYWRSPRYIYSKLFLVSFSSLFIGFSFFKSDTTLQSLQNLMFSIFMLTSVLGPCVQQYLPYFVSQRDLYEARERPSKMFSWKAFMAAQITAEIPIESVLGIICYFCWYYPIGLYRNMEVGPSNLTHHNSVNTRGGLLFFYLLVFFIYISAFAQMIQAGIELADTAGNVSNLLFMMSLVFCGVLATKEALPGFWIFMYRISPMTYLIPGVLSVAVANTKVLCSDIEYVKFPPPKGQSCGKYMKPYIKAKGGYLQNVSSTDICSYCSTSSTNAYLATIDIDFHTRWRNLGLLMAYVLISYAGAFLLYWLVRVPKKKTRVKKQ